MTAGQTSKGHNVKSPDSDAFQDRGARIEERGTRHSSLSPQHSKTFVLSLEPMLDALEALLRGQLQCQQRLLDCVDRKRQAIRTAAIDSVAGICAQEQAILAKIVDLERHRAEHVLRITQLMNDQKFQVEIETQKSELQTLTIGEIASLVPEPRQSRLITLAAQLREALANVKRESSIVRAAADALSRHMAGVVQQVHAALSGTRVYGERGKIVISGAAGSQVSSIVDVKS